MKIRSFQKTTLLSSTLFTATMLLSANAATVFSTVAKEATVQSGTSAASNIDEVLATYIHIKYENPVNNSARKAYFQFDLTGQNANLAQGATFTVTLSSGNAQSLQFWALNQAYTGFTDSVTWNTAQANSLTTNDMLNTGTFSATAIGAPQQINQLSGTTVSANLAALTPYVFGNKITFAITGVDWATNNAGGLRIARADSATPAKLDFQAVPEPSVALLGALGMLGLLRRCR